MTKVSLQEYKKNLPEPLRSRTLCFLVKDGKVLLGQKKKGFGQGYWLGIGGKVEQGESVKDAMIRETVEEIGIKPTRFTEVATLDFYFPYVEEPKKWNQRVHVFIVDGWEGKPQESEEIHPEWFEIRKVPLELMWSDASHWLPKVLQGERLNLEFTFDRELKVEEVNAIKPV
jgi:8-oxo-dGTP diphosphatase